jgi:hypothetical protein
LAKPWQARIDGRGELHHIIVRGIKQRVIFSKIQMEILGT